MVNQVFLELRVREVLEDIKAVLESLVVMVMMVLRVDRVRRVYQDRLDHLVIRCARKLTISY